MSRVALLCFLSALALVAIPTADDRRNPGNQLPAPTLVAAEILPSGDSDCDGDDLSSDNVCARMVFTKVSSATK